MLRVWIWLTPLLYLGLALAFGSYEVMQNPLWKLDTRTIGEMIGGGLFIYGASAAVPGIAWGFTRFRQHVARPVFLAWLVIGAALAYFSDAGKRIDRTASTAKPSSNSAFSGKDRKDFEQSVKLGCEQTQRADPL